ncbi:lysM domain-containing GPI-anchored protein 1-like [Diospyros lotus]|uniref:lysM domain-containing GPI-anchored protein 1-like n=1 Tax=Diospyros lotus TaxID=55363 RepID=UPI00225B9D1D|nr:lysM domain-containing GPI-anchored protein 1-like [Diospyros lotus]
MLPSQMPNLNKPISFSSLSRLLLLLPLLLLIIINDLACIVTSKSTIEPCSNSDTCSAMVGYTLYTDLKVSEVAALFQVDPISLLTANAIDISYPDVENHILPSQLFLKIPVPCSCVDGIRKSAATRYKTRPSDTLSTIADSVFGGLVSADQLREANSISDPSVLDVGQTLVVPLPCTCFNGTDNFLPAIYMSYVVKPADSLAGIAARYFTTITDLMTVNALGETAIKAGDILAIPLSACASNFPRYASDYGLSVPNGSYAITASHCVQCSCGPGNRNLYCMPASLAVSCSSMQCRHSNLMLGNVTWQQSTAGCNVTSCSYSGYVNGTIITTLSTSLQPRCPGPQQFPPLIVPPTSVSRDSFLTPAPAPSEAGGSPTATTPKSSSVPSSISSVGLPPANAPSGGVSGSGSSSSSSSTSATPLARFPCAIFLGIFVDLMLSSSLL